MQLHCTFITFTDLSFQYLNITIKLNFRDQAIFVSLQTTTKTLKIIKSILANTFLKVLVFCFQQKTFTKSLKISYDPLINYDPLN